MIRAAILPAILLLGLSFRSAAEESTFSAQQIQFDTGTRPATRQHVELLEETYTLQANKPEEVELRFRIAPGLHINSHTPKDELLLPTVLKLVGTPAVQILDQHYPAGHPFHLNIGAGETLDVYQDELRLRIRVTATPGSHAVEGTLRYQACDTASCFPPRTLALHLTLLAK